MTINIFDIEKNEREKNFIIENGSKEIEVIADLIDAGLNLPFWGSMLKLGKVALNIKDLFFFKKLSTFLVEADKINKEKKNEFFSSLNKSTYERISSYMLHVLYSAEEKDKAFILARIYRARILEEVDNEEMLRLCSIVNRVFLPDFQHLGEYVEENDEETIASQSFINLGLIDNYVGGYWMGSPKQVLNETGQKLFHILDEARWFSAVGD